MKKTNLLPLLAVAAGGLYLANQTGSKPSTTQDKLAFTGDTFADEEALKDALIKVIKANNIELRTLLRGNDGAKGEKGDTGNDAIANIGNNTFGDGQMILNPNGQNYTEIYMKGLSKKFRLININDKLSIVSMTNDGIDPLVVLEIQPNGTISKIAGGSFSALSDERLKEKIETFNSGLDKVLSIQPRSFNYKKVKGTQTESYPDFICDKKQYGVIAQELQKVCPEMVTIAEDGFMSVDLSNLPLLLVNAVKDLNTKDVAQQKVIDSQKTEITNLKKSLISIEERLTKLEAPTA